MAVTKLGIAPSEFWGMTPKHFWWIVEAHMGKAEKRSVLSKEDKGAILDALRGNRRGEVW